MQHLARLALKHDACALRRHAERRNVVVGSSYCVPLCTSPSIREF